jgi:hypothetical protein
MARRSEGCMSLLSWFSRRKPAKVVPPSPGPSHAEPARPAVRPEAPATERQLAQRRNERMAQRERLYVVVRDCMNRAGVLSSGYKFKVLSLDKRGGQFLVMVDLAGREAATAAALAQIEATIAQAAKARHDIEVKGVYWRQNEQVSATLQARAAAAAQPQTIQAAKAARRPAAVARAPAAEPAPMRSAFDPVDADEVAAFKRALAAGLQRPATADASAQNYALLTGYEDTELPEQRPRPSSLSGSQYGDLN